MVADQLVTLSEGGEQRYDGVATLNYVDFPQHEHWHLTPFSHYTLRGDVGDTLDVKQGFCLVAGFSNNFCGQNNTTLNQLTMGIVSGLNDSYTRVHRGPVHTDLRGHHARRRVRADPRDELGGRPPRGIAREQRGLGAPLDHLADCRRRAHGLGAEELPRQRQLPGEPATAAASSAAARNTTAAAGHAASTSRDAATACRDAATAASGHPGARRAHEPRLGPRALEEGVPA